jgi:hypothetical protein
MPFNMVELSGPPFKNRPSCEGSQTGKYSFSPHYPEHVESPQGIERMKTFWLLIVFHDTYFR